MPLDLSEIVEDPDLSQTWMLLRSTGEFVAGGFQSTTTQIPFSGIAEPASDAELQMIPEGDRVTQAFTFISTQPMYTTRAGDQAGVSDKILFQGSTYRLMNVGPWQAHGFYSALGLRMEGD